MTILGFFGYCSSKICVKVIKNCKIEAIGDVNDGDVLRLELTGVLYDPIPFETPIEGADCVVIRGKFKPTNRAGH